MTGKNNSKLSLKKNIFIRSHIHTSYHKDDKEHAYDHALDAWIQVRVSIQAMYEVDFHNGDGLGNDADGNANALRCG